MPIGKFKVYLVGFSLDTRIAKKLAEFVMKEEGFEDIVFIEANRTEQVNYAEAKMVWFFPIPSTAEDDIRKIEVNMVANEIPIERYEMGRDICKSNLWTELYAKKDAKSA